MHSEQILKYLQKHGQRIDLEIAEAIGVPLARVRLSLANLSARGEISRCNVTRFDDGRKIEGMLCRIAGTVPAAAPGRKPGASRRESAAERPL